MNNENEREEKSASRFAATALLAIAILAGGWIGCVITAISIGPRQVNPNCPQHTVKSQTRTQSTAQVQPPFLAMSKVWN